MKILTVMGVVSSRQGAGNYISGNFKGYMVDALSMMFMLDKLDYDQITTRSVSDWRCRHMHLQ
ncbi:MAG: hypothetical protein ACLVI9_05375 [Anaerostipes hadrus]